MTFQQLQSTAESFDKTEKIPVMFLGHGSPMNAIEENTFVAGFRDASAKIKKPNAILCISAHWYTDGTFITSGKRQRTIHDFYGFPEELFAVEYPAKGNPELAKETKDLLLPNIVKETEDWGLDHGAWSVLKHFYPEADIPVIQLSIDYKKEPQWHFELAKKLRKLRDHGVLIIGSGNIVHNLRLVDFKNIDTVGYSFDWALEARDRVNHWLLDGDFNSLINYNNSELALQYAIPTPEHFLPLLYTIALREKVDDLSLFNDEIVGGSLSMTSVRIG